MPTARGIEAADASEGCRLGLTTCFPRPLPYQPGHDRLEEGLDCGVITAVSLADLALGKLPPSGSGVARRGAVWAERNAQSPEGKGCNRPPVSTWATIASARGATIHRIKRRGFLSAWHGCRSPGSVHLRLCAIPKGGGGQSLQRRPKGPLAPRSCHKPQQKKVPQLARGHWGEATARLKKSTGMRQMERGLAP